MIFASAALFILTVMCLINWLVCEFAYRRYSKGSRSLTTAQITGVSEIYSSLVRRAKDAFWVFIVTLLSFVLSVTYLVLQSYDIIQGF